MTARDDLSLRVDPGAARALAEAHAWDAFALLGPHRDARGTVVRAFLPEARHVELVELGNGHARVPLQSLQVPGLFAGRYSGTAPYALRIEWPDGVQETEDPYSFGLLLGELDLHLIAQGRHFELSRCLGAQAMTLDGVPGVRFAVWAPNARRVSVVGDFNAWDGRRHPMRCRLEAGVWEIFIPRLKPGTLYKYEILGRDGVLPLKADPVALQAEGPPSTASIVADPAPFHWTDADWMAQRAQRQSPQAPVSIYEVHAGSWRHSQERPGHAPTWDEFGDKLIPYVSELGFTHVELLPITAHPFRGSWGYQPLGMFAPQPDYGDPAGFKRFIDRCHAASLGVIVDWVPGHFPNDPHGMARFDGTALYEHEDPREGLHQDWNTLIYNFGRAEVRGFLIASALHWLEQFHIDGLRVDAVASMLYRDYSRKPGDWIPNRYGGRENLEAVDFLRQLNDAIRARAPGALTFAEESTAWPGVTHDTAHGGLGFGYKWNMGWMHDTLRYIARDPVHRGYHHDDLTFGLVYAFSERFVLPLSHDEVVHGKGSLLARMPGDRWQQFANLRAYFGFMWAHPGKKLLFMGGEFAQPREWDHDGELEWGRLGDPLHAGVQQVVRDLNRLYAAQPALHAADCEGAGFHWVIGDDRRNSVYAFWRTGGFGDRPVLAVSNFTPVVRHGYRIGVPRGGRWCEIFNSDAQGYGGSGVGNGGEVTAQQAGSHGLPFSLTLTLPPLSTLLLVSEG